MALILDYGFSNFLLKTLVGPVFQQIASTMVDSFVKRADEVATARSESAVRRRSRAARVERRGLLRRADAATRIDVRSPAGATVSDGDRPRAAIVERLGLDLASLAFAIFGRRATPDTALDEGDRVELLRPLSVDPKEARRRRVAKKGGAGDRRG